MMFITPEDYRYLEGLHESLTPPRRERLMALLLGKTKPEAGREGLKDRVRIVGQEIYNEQGVDPKEWITRTMIKKSYKDAKLA